MKAFKCQSVPSALLVFAVLVVLSPARAAWACSVAPGPPTLMGQPSDKSEGVPTNVVMHYLFPTTTVRFEDPPDKVTGAYVLRSASGEEVPLRVTRPSRSELEIVPMRTLEPKTSYMLEASWPRGDGRVDEAAVRFATADGPSDETPPPPIAVLRHYDFGRAHSVTCGPPMQGTCLSLEDDQRLIELTSLDDKGVVLEKWLGRGSSLSYGARGGTRGCLELRQFGANGVRSEPSRVCADEAPRTVVTDLLGEVNVGCTAAGLDWCDTTGVSGSEPGPAEPRGASGGASCPVVPNNLTGAAGGASPAAENASASAFEIKTEPAAGSCSAAVVRSKAMPHPGLFALLSVLGMLVGRRSARMRRS